MPWPGRRRGGDEEFARDVDQALASLSQTHSDADQTASDLDAGASGSDQQAAWQDQVSADSDQRASDRDQAASDRGFIARDAPSSAERDRHEQSRDERAHSTQQREGSQLSRAGSEIERIRADAQRLETAAVRDDVAGERDRAADLREAAALRSERAALAADPGNPTLRGVITANGELRDHTIVDRRRAASDRMRAAEDRLAAAAAQRQMRIDVQAAQVGDVSGDHAKRLGYAALRAEIDRSRRNDDPFVLAIINVGEVHKCAPQPDQLDEKVVDVVITSLRKRLRSYDPIVRISGQQFICGLSRTEPEAALERVQTIRSTIHVKHPAIAITVGFAVLEASDSLDTLISRAAVDPT